MTNIFKAFDKATDRAVANPVSNWIMGGLGVVFLTGAIGLGIAEKAKQPGATVSVQADTNATVQISTPSQ